MSIPKAAKWERRPEDRPHEVLDAAVRVFAEKGYHATKMEEIADVAGVAKGTIYHYFPNKEALLSSLVDRAVATRVIPMEELVRESAPTGQKLRLIFARTRTNLLSPYGSALTRIIIGDVSRAAPALFRRWADEVLVRGCSLIEELIVEGQWNGEFRRDADAKAAARFYVSGILMQSMLYLTMGVGESDPVDVGSLLDGSFDLFLKGLQAS